jgi:hypothetical protein
MTLAILGYFAVTLLTLMGLARMILQVGRTMGDCPQSGARARGAAMAIASGFLAIGMGGAILLAALIPALANVENPAGMGVVTLLAVGLCCMTLGLGFAHALRNLRALVQPAPAAIPATLPEPVLG